MAQTPTPSYFRFQIQTLWLLYLTRAVQCCRHTASKGHLTVFQMIQVISAINLDAIRSLQNLLRGHNLQPVCRLLDY